MFSELFKKSSLPSLVQNQVLSSSSFKHDLNFGLKHALPKSIHPYVIVKDLDDAVTKKPVVHSAWSTLARDHVWKENLINFKKNIDTSESFSIDSVIKSDKYKELLNQAKGNQKTDLHSFIVENMPKSEKKFIHPPWYDSKTDQNLVNKVKGRILNRVSGGYSVGISGIVAFLPNEYYSYQALIDQIKKGQKPGLQKAHLGTMVSRAVDRDSVYEFYVVLARYDPLLRPEVVLSILPPKEEINQFGLGTKRRKSDNMINLMKILSKKT